MDNQLARLIGGPSIKEEGETISPATGLHASLEDLQEVFENSKEFLESGFANEVSKEINDYSGRLGDLNKKEQELNEHASDAAKDGVLIGARRGSARRR